MNRNDVGRIVNRTRQKGSSVDGHKPITRIGQNEAQFEYKILIPEPL